MAFEDHVKRAQPAVFSLLALFSLAAWIQAAVLVRSYNHRGNYPNNSIKDRTRFVLFTGLWSFVFCIVYIAGFLTAAGHFLFSIASHAIFLFITWVFWLAAAASITAANNDLHCKSHHLAHCNQINAAEGFSWINWILITFALIFVLFLGGRSARTGNGFGAALV